MKNNPTPGETLTASQPQIKLAAALHAISYVTSRSPKSKVKKRITTNGSSLFTPSRARVPPAWTDLWMTTDAKSPLQAIGRDVKGRRVYLYSAEHMGIASAAKFSRLKAFSQAYLSLIRRVRRDMKTSEDALVLYLIAKTGFRIGSDAETRAAVKAFGASTLRCSQVNIDGNKLSFDFIGKKGIRVNKVLRDRILAANIGDRCAIRPDSKIFRTSDKQIRAYLKSISKSNEFTVKDFRTYIGTLTAFRKIKTMPLPQSARERKRYEKEVARTVGQELGNSPAIALNSYVSPEVFCLWDADSPQTEKAHRATHSSFTKEFLDCVHYDRDVPMHRNTGPDPSD
jgi:DNA topoisomerase I